MEEKKKHDCDYDPNSKSPFASCRMKHPPNDNYQPYVGAATVEKKEDDREKTQSWLRNVDQEYKEYEKKIRLEKEEKEDKENKLKMLTMNEE